MSRLLAIEWDDREARLAVAAVARGGARIEELVALPLAEDGAEELSVAEVGRRIAAAVAERKLEKVETLVAVARASIELKSLTLPPAPDDELPDLVRFQALREFNNMGEDWPLDFVPLSGGGEEPRTVLAAAMAPAALKEVTTVCAAAQVEPRHVVLRPCAAAALLRRRTATHRVRLLIDLLGDEADLTVLLGDTVAFMRTARLSHGHTEAERTTAILGELRRTLAAVTNQLSGQRVEQVCIGGNSSQERALATAVTEQLKLPALVFDPLEGLDLAPQLARALPQEAGRFAPLIGMLLDEAAEQIHAIDFLSPKKRPEPPSRKRQYTLIAGAAAAVVAVALGGIWFDLSRRDAENTELATKLANQKKLVEEAAVAQKELAEIEAWRAGDISWLDVIARASERSQPPEEIRVTNLNITSDTRGPMMSVTGLAKSAATIDKAEENLRGGEYRVESRGSRPDASVPGFEREFTAILRAGEPPAPAARNTRQGPTRAAPRAPIGKNR